MTSLLDRFAAYFTPGQERRRGGMRRAVAFSAPWVAFPLVGVLGDDISAGHKALALAGAAAFLALYAVALMTPPMPREPPPARTLAAIAGLLAITVVLDATDDGRWGAVLFVLTAVVAGVRLSATQAAPAVIGVALTAAITEVATGGSAGDVLGTVLTTLGIGGMMLGFARLIATNRELEAAQMEIARLAVADERLRFARDLHDLLGHSLSVIALKSELATRLLDRDPAQAAAHVHDVERVAREALGEVRDAVSGYRRPTLAAELAAARVALEAAGIELEVQRRAAPAELPGEVETVLAWGVREAATNAARHSGATRCRVALAVEGDAATLEVVDDGRGARGDGATASVTGGSGLAGLAERAARAAGRLEAGGAPGGGFRLALRVPLEPAT